MSKCDVVILFSGGADSYLMLKMALMAGKQPHCLLIDYEQKHVEELEFAKKQLIKENVNWQVVKLRGMNISSGLTGPMLLKNRWENVNEMYVPMRNTIFLGLAMGVAEDLDINEVWIGSDYSDRINNFSDCTQEYVVKMNELAAIAGAKPMQIVAPLLGMTKELIIDILYKKFGIGLVDMYSGYEAPEIEETKTKIM